MDLISPVAAFQTPVASAAIVTPTNETEDNCWYAFYSESQKREYYYNPDSGRSTWVLPAGARRSRMVETNSGFTPTAKIRFSFDMFDDNDDCDQDDEHSSADGAFREKSVVKANLIVLGMFFVGMLLSVTCSALNIGGLLSSAARALDSVEETVARTNSVNMQSHLKRRAAEDRHVLYYSSWLNVLNNPSGCFSISEEILNSASEQCDDRGDVNHSKHPFYYPNWWNVLEHSRDPPRDLELDQIVHNLVSSLETADVLLNQIVTDAQQAGMEVGTVTAE